MPDSGPVNALRTRLAGAMALTRAQRDLGWGDPKAMKLALADVRRVFGGGDDTAQPARNDLVDAVRQFFRDQQAGTFTQLKYVCYGVTVPVDADGQRLIDRAPLFTRLLELVEQRQGQPKQFRRCYQGLMSGYFGFSGASTAAAATANNWLTLRGFLGSRLQPVAVSARARGREPAWLDTLAKHSNLLGDKPCVRYAEALRRGDQSELAGVCKGLDISSDSWVWHEAVMAYVQAVAGADDPPFQREMPQVLAIIDGQQADLTLPRPVAREAAALLVARYARCRDMPEQPQLRDVCIRWIGNPWLERAAWDSAVNSEPARVMIESWLKRRLITDFFELLAHDGAADLRRLNYWLKWEPQISDMWFVLGGDALRKDTEKYRAVRQRMAGRDRVLTGTSDGSNNAFVMRIGPLLIIEFGAKGNACFMFQAGDFATDLGQSALSIFALKQRLHGNRQSHSGDWEPKFDREMKELLRRSVLGQTAVVELPRPPAAAGQSVVSRAERKAAQASITDRPALAPHGRSKRVSLSGSDLLLLRKTCLVASVPLVDNRHLGGAIWVKLLDTRTSPSLSTWLIERGFRFVAGKGYYIDEAN